MGFSLLLSLFFESRGRGIFENDKPPVVKRLINVYHFLANPIHPNKSDFLANVMVVGFKKP